MADGDYIYCGKHWVMYRIVKSPYYTPEANITLYWSTDLQLKKQITKKKKRSISNKVDNLEKRPFYASKYLLKPSVMIENDT